MSNVLSDPDFKPIIRSRKATEERLLECLSVWVKSEIEFDFARTPGRKMATYSENGPEYKEFAVSGSDPVQCAKRMIDVICNEMLNSDLGHRVVDGKAVNATHVAWRVEPEMRRHHSLIDEFRCYTRFILLDSSEIVSELETVNE